jgi:hypothetical protein
LDTFLHYDDLFASHSISRGHFFLARLSAQSPQMVMSGLQGWNPSCRASGSAFRCFFSRAVLMFVTLDIFCTVLPKNQGSHTGLPLPVLS